MIFWQEARNLGGSGMPGEGSGANPAQALALPQFPEGECETPGPKALTASGEHVGTGAPPTQCTPHLFCGEKRYSAQDSRLRHHSGL